MNSFHNIEFDTDYLQVSTHCPLLHDHHLPQASPSIVVALPNALLLTFIQKYRDLVPCQQHISNIRQKMIRLFVSNNKLRYWIDNIDHNLCDIFIFCDTFRSYLDMKRRNGCHQEKIRKVFSYEKLDYQLLYVGLEHMRTIQEEFSQDDGVRAKICADANRILDALGNYFAHSANNKQTKLSEENTEY